MNSLVLIGYCIGNFAGPFVWEAKYRPRNHPPWTLIAVAEVVACGILIALRQMFANENKRRDELERSNASQDTVFDHVQIKHVNADGVVEMRKVDKVRLYLSLALSMLTPHRLSWILPT